MGNKQDKKQSTKMDNKEKAKGLVIIPYVENLSEKATRVFKRHEI